MCEAAEYRLLRQGNSPGQELLLLEVICQCFLRGMKSARQKFQRGNRPESGLQGLFSFPALRREIDPMMCVPHGHIEHKMHETIPSDSFIVRSSLRQTHRFKPRVILNQAST